LFYKSNISVACGRTFFLSEYEKKIRIYPEYKKVMNIKVLDFRVRVVSYMPSSMHNSRSIVIILILSINNISFEVRGLRKAI